MAKKQVSLEVSSNTYDVVSAMVRLAGKVKERLDDGFQLDQDLAALLPELVALGGEVSKVGEMDDEMREDAAAWATALVAGAAPLAAVFKKKETEEPSA